MSQFGAPGCGKLAFWAVPVCLVAHIPRIIGNPLTPGLPAPRSMARLIGDKGGASCGPGRRDGDDTRRSQCHDRTRFAAYFGRTQRSFRCTVKRPKSTSSMSQGIENSTEKKMAKKTTAKTSENSRHEEANLDSRYGQIGISAVAAAVQYQGGIKNPAPAPVVYAIDERLVEAA